MSSRIVTIKEPKAIEPRDRVEARTNADAVGCLGYGEPKGQSKRFRTSIPKREGPPSSRSPWGQSSTTLE